MKRQLLFLLAFGLLPMAMQAQLFIEEFDTDATEITYTNGFSVTSAYSVVEFDYTGTYSDGGYGGTSCEPGTGP